MLFETPRLDFTSGACGELNSWESFVSDSGRAIWQAYAEPLGIAFVALTLAILVMLTVRSAVSSETWRRSLAVMLLVSIAAAIADMVINPYQIDPQRFSLISMATFLGVGGWLLYQSLPANRQNS